MNYIYNIHMYYDFNLTCIISRWELSGKEVGKPVVRAISSNLTLLTEELESCTHAHNGEKICRILTKTLGQMTTHVQLDQYLKIARAIICFFFTLLYQEKGKLCVQFSVVCT